MDALSNAIDILRQALGRPNRFHEGRSRPSQQGQVPVYGVVPQEYRLGGDDWDIIQNAEGLKLHVLGLDNAPRLRRRDTFLCQAEPATQAFANQCLGGMKMQGECILLTHLLTRGGRQVPWQRTLLEPSDQIGRQVGLAWKIADGLDYQVGYRLPKPFTITKHLQSVIWLDRVPEQAEGASGYMVVEFLKQT